MGSPFSQYLDSDVQAALRDLRVAYSQANLLTEGELIALPPVIRPTFATADPPRSRPAARTAAFTLPDAHAGPTKSFDYVFDFTGEHDFDLPEPVHVERTIKLAIALGRTALVHKVGVYARILSPFYRLPGDKKGQVGAPDGAAAEPWGVRAAMHHEAARALALIDGLNFVLLRPGLMYGDFVVTGITPRLLVAEVYKFLGEKLEFLWAEGLAQSTVHVKDCAVAAIKAVEWAAKTPKEERLKLAGEELPTTLKSNELIKGVDGAAKKEDAARAVVFNLVDDGATTQADIAKAVGEAVGVESGFHGTIISSFAKLNMGDVLEDVNEKHLEAWSDLLTASDPPISTALPISPHIVSRTADLQPAQTLIADPASRSIAACRSPSAVSDQLQFEQAQDCPWVRAAVQAQPRRPQAGDRQLQEGGQLARRYPKEEVSSD